MPLLGWTFIIGTIIKLVKGKELFKEESEEYQEACEFFEVNSNDSLVIKQREYLELSFEYLDNDDIMNQWIIILRL